MRQEKSIDGPPGREVTENTEKSRILTKLFLFNLSTDNVHLAKIDEFPPEKVNNNSFKTTQKNED